MLVKDSFYDSNIADIAVIKNNTEYWMIKNFKEFCGFNNLN